MNYLKMLRLMACSTAVFSTVCPQSQSVFNINDYKGRAVDFSEIVCHFSSPEQALAEILKSGAVILDFYADWCGPCKSMTPVFKSVAHQYGNALFVKINTDDYKSIANKYRVKSIPTIMYVKNGNVIERTTGLVSEKVMRTKVAAISPKSQRTKTVKQETKTPTVSQQTPEVTV